ncbi:MAG: hypothetical protein QF475_00760, partial [Candidatus Undinarchaeales archaeon]|nr:hypothetical protein [Candidatus Undinarchaeales archaeon]
AKPLTPVKPLPAIKPIAKPVATPVTKPTSVVKPAVKPVQPTPVTKPADPAVAYVKSCRANGFTDAQIKVELKKQGWGDADIAKKMNAAK